MNTKHLLPTLMLISCMNFAACNDNENNDIVEEKKTLTQQLYIYKSYEQDQGFNNESIGGIFKLYNESPDSYTHISVRNYYCVTDCENFLSKEEKQQMQSSFPIDTLYLSGLKDNRLWVAAYNTVSKKKLFEMTSSNTIDTEYVKHMGYGEYKNFNLNSIHIGYRGDSDYDDYWWYSDKFKAIRFIASYNSGDNEWDGLTHILFNHGENCQVIPSDHMIPWYNDSYLFSFQKKNNYDTNTTFYGYYENGEYNTPILVSTLFTYSVNLNKPGILMDEDRDYAVPFDYDKYITGTTNGYEYSIYLYELIRKNNPDFIDFEYYEWEPKLWIDLGHQEKDKDKVTMKILEEDYNGMEWIWKIQLNVLRYDGEQINDEYVISLNEGKIIEHNGKVVQ